MSITMEMNSMSADISALGNLNSAEPLDFELYADAKAGFDLPKAGVYTLRAPDSFPSTSFGATNAGYLSAQIDPTIMGPTNEGFNIRFTKVSAKSFKRSGVTVSQLGDYLRACGRAGAIPGEPQAQADAVAETAGRVYQAELDWRAYNKNTGFQVEGMKNFPKLANGEHQSWIEDPQEKSEDGTPVRLRANLSVRRYLPASSN